MTIDPRIGFYLGLIATVLVFSSTGTGATQLADVFGSSLGHTISSACGYLGGICTLVVGLLHSVPSNNAPGDAKKFYAGPKAAVVFLSLAFTGLLIGSQAKAADALPLKVPSTSALFTGYPYQGSGFYWGLSMGATSATPTIDGQTATGLTAFGGSLGAAVGYQWGAGNVAYAIESDAWWNNIGGSSNCDGASCSLTSRFSFEQRIKMMTPISTVLGMFPALNNLPQLPALPVLPQGVSTVASNPYIMVGLHEDDVSAGYGLQTGSAWQFAPGIGVGNLIQLSNKTALDLWGEWIPSNSSFAIGPNVTADQGQQFRFGMSVLW